MAMALPPVPWDLPGTGAEAVVPLFGVNGLPLPGAILRLAAAGYCPPVTGSPIGPSPWTSARTPPGLVPPAPAQNGVAGLGLNVPGAQGRPSSVEGPACPRVPEKVNTLQTHLKQLQREDPEHVFIARGISRMGFGSQQLLKTHYSKYGRVVRVMVTHSKVKPVRGVGAQARIRPGSLGFVVMDSAASIARILAVGAEQTVDRFRIRVERFQQMTKPEGLPAASPTARPGSRSMSSADKPNDSSSNDSEGSISAVGTAPADDQCEAPGIGELATSLSKLVQIMSQSDRMGAFSGQQCVEAVALSRSAQQQLQGLLDQCNQRLSNMVEAAPDAYGVEAREPALVIGLADLARTLVPNDLSAAFAAQLAQEQARSLHQRYAQALGAEHGPWPWHHPHPLPHRRWHLEHPPRARAWPEAAPVPAPHRGLTGAALTAAAAAAAVAAVAAASAAHSPLTQRTPQAEQQAPATPSLAASDGTMTPAPDRLANKQTLGMHLTQLQNQDPKHVFIARRISGMGFQSQELLASHYSQYGGVFRVLVAHSKVKPFRSGRTQPRIRPGSLGFVVMVTQESVERIFAAGKEQIVAGCCICVEPFEQTAKPREGRASAGDSTSTATGDTPGSGSRSGSNGSENGSGSGSNGSEKGSDKSSREKGSDKSSREKGSDKSSREKGSDKSSQDKGLRENNEGGSTDSQLAESSESGSGTEGKLSPGQQAGAM